MPYSKPEWLWKPSKGKEPFNRSIAKEFNEHPVQVSEWKKRLSTQAERVFETGWEKPHEDFSSKRNELHSKIEEITVMLDFAVKKSKQLGVRGGLPNS